MNKQSGLDIRKYLFSQRTNNVWNKLSTDCVHASTTLQHVSFTFNAFTIDKLRNLSEEKNRCSHLEINVVQNTSSVRCGANMFANKHDKCPCLDRPDFNGFIMDQLKK